MLGGGGGMFWTVVGDFIMNTGLLIRWNSATNLSLTVLPLFALRVDCYSPRVTPHTLGRPVEVANTFGPSQWTIKGSIPPLEISRQAVGDEGIR